MFQEVRNVGTWHHLETFLRQANVTKVLDLSIARVRLWIVYPARMHYIVGTILEMSNHPKIMEMSGSSWPTTWNLT
jgi:hypothetical protein